MRETLALHGGAPVRENKLKLFSIHVGGTDISTVVQVLSDGCLSRGDYPKQFEEKLRQHIGVPSAVVMSSGTSALHAALLSCEFPEGSEIIVPSLSFVATALAPIYCGHLPVFADIDPDSWTLDPADVQRKITKRTRAIISVDYGGYVSNMEALREISSANHLTLIQDAAHSVGATLNGQKVGKMADLTCFSFFATKNITSGEGGAVLSLRHQDQLRLERIRAHGITHEPGPRISGFYDVTQLGFNFHLSNLNIALVSSQFERLGSNLSKRAHLANVFFSAIDSDRGLDIIKRQPPQDGRAFHLLTVNIEPARCAKYRDELVRALHAEGIEAGVYYRPTHLFRYFKERLGCSTGLLPVTEKICDGIITLPLYPELNESDMFDCARALKKVVSAYMV